MATNSFGKRNFMQPMGRPKNALKCLAFFPFKLWGEGMLFFHFSLVPNVFSLCSHQVPIKLPKFPKLLPSIFSIAPHFYPVCFGKCCPPLTYIGGPKGRNSILQNRTLFWGAFIISFLLSDGPIKLAHCNK